jgi:hypothetical protein
VIMCQSISPLLPFYDTDGALIRKASNSRGNEKTRATYRQHGDVMHTECYSNDKIKEAKKSRSCSMHGRDKKCVQKFGRETRRYHIRETCIYGTIFDDNVKVRQNGY